MPSGEVFNFSSPVTTCPEWPQTINPLGTRGAQFGGAPNSQLDAVARSARASRRISNGVEEQARDDHGDDEMWPDRPRPVHEPRRGDDREVADRVVAAEQPHRADVRVPLAVREQDESRGDVHNQCDQADDAHHVGFGYPMDESPLDGGPDHPHAKRGQEEALKQRSPRPPERPPPDGKQSEQRDQAVPEEIDGVSLERLGAGDDAACHLGHAHCQVEGDDDHQRPPVAGVVWLKSFGPQQSSQPAYSLLMTQQLVLDVEQAEA